MRNLRMLIMVVVLLVVGTGNVFGDTVYTTNPGASYFVDYISSGYAATNIYYGADFTFDGVPNEDVYIIGMSQFSDGLHLNVAGYNVGGESFTFRIYGDGVTSRPISELFVIIDDGDGYLFSIGDGGVLNMGLGSDEILFSGNVSINGGSFGDLNAIGYVVGQSPVELNSLSIVTPEPATIALLGFGCLLLRKRKG